MSDAVGKITEIRATRPEAIREALTARRRRPLLAESGTLFFVAADHPARGSIKVGDDPRADPRASERTDTKFQLSPSRIAAMEEAIDRFETELPPLRQFILAGGGQAGALLHVARTVCRRAERRVVALSEQIEIHTGIVKYLNRLSDFLFVLARIVNHRQGRQEIPW